MSTITPTVEDLPVTLPSDRRIKLITWAGMVNGDAGAPAEMSESADRSIQVTGTFDTSTIVWEGSNDGVTYATLNDPQGNLISKTAAAIEQVVEVCRYMRPRVSAGGASTALTAILLVRR